MFPFKIQYAEQTIIGFIFYFTWVHFSKFSMKIVSVLIVIFQDLCNDIKYFNGEMEYSEA